MSDEHTIKWKSVDKSVKKSLIDQPSVKAMPKEDWYQILRSIKEDKHAVQRMYKLIMASGDGKKTQFHDSALSRLGQCCAEKECRKR